MSLKRYHIKKSWTLFLDRDGVINRRIVDDYVKNAEEFEFLPLVPESLGKLSGIFNRLIVVTNQQGIGKGILTGDDVESVHQHFLLEIKPFQANINKIYVCPDLESMGSHMRKPNIGMALAAQKDFPDIDFEKSIMVGDSQSDMDFGKKAGMITVFINSENNEIPDNADMNFATLKEFADQF